MRSHALLAVVAAFCLMAACAIEGIAAQVKYEVTISAPDTGYSETPVWVPVKAPAEIKSGCTPRMVQADGRPVPCQFVRDGSDAWVVFILRGLNHGETRLHQLTLSDQPSAQRGPGVEVKPEGDEVTVTVGDSMLTRYCFAGTSKPYCYPVIGPGGAALTRNYPMKEAAGESTDHPHQRSFWFGFGDINGKDFWTEGKGCGRIVHRGFEALESGPVVGRIRARNDWTADDGAKVGADVRELRFYRTREGQLLDFTITIQAGETPLHFGDTKEGMFAFRIACSMDLIRGKGHIVNSAGQTNTEAWGKRADWCDYSGPVEGRTVGIAIFDNPANFRHPTFWHVRDYGLFAANPFGLRYYLGEEKGDEGLRIMPGESLTFRYRVLLHGGGAEQANVATLYAEYARPPQVTVR